MSVSPVRPISLYLRSRMKMTIEFPRELLASARTVASRRGLTVEEFIVLSVSNRVSVEGETKAFFRERRSALRDA